MTGAPRGTAAFINGEWLKASEEFPSLNPANPEDVLGYFGDCDESLVKAATETAHTTFRSWASTPSPVRAGIIQNFGLLVEKNKEMLARVVTREIGKPYKESLGSVQEVIDTANFFVSEGRRLYGQTIPSEMPAKECFTYRRPMGVFGCLTACNFPVAVPAWYFIPALVSGNTCVWKPSEDAPLTSYFFTELLHHAGIPKGVFNTVMGRGPTTGQTLIKLVDSGLFAKIGFTGSTEVGKQVGEICGRNLIVPCLELGGKNPLIVCPDANMELALEGALFSGFATAGQRCTSLGNLILHQDIHDEFLQKLVAKAEKLTIGDPISEKIDYGPLISQKFLENHLKQLETLIAPHHQLPLGKGGHIGQGAEWNNFIGKNAKGYFAKPTIVSGVKKSDPIYCTETFGPIFNVLAYQELEEAIDLANDHGYGLSSAIYSRDPETIYVFKETISAGMSSINNSTVGAEAHLPFGGNQKSGNGGRQSGIWVIDQFTKWHAVNWDMSGKLQKAQMDTGYIEAKLDYSIG